MDTIMTTGSFTWATDTPVFYVEASSFPEGVMEAHRKLHQSLDPETRRRFFGLSRPDGPGGQIRYLAAAEELESGEAEKLGLERMVIPKGRYTSITIENYMTNLDAIGDAFRQLIKLPGIDAEGYCIEWYLSREKVKCLVRMAEASTTTNGDV